MGTCSIKCFKPKIKQRISARESRKSLSPQKSLEIKNICFALEKTDAKENEAEKRITHSEIAPIQGDSCSDVEDPSTFCSEDRQLFMKSDVGDYPIIEQYICKLFQSKKFSPSLLLKEHGIKPFDKNNFLILTKYGEGSFGKVFRSFRKHDRELVALKYFQMQTAVKRSSNKIIDNAICMFVEKNILEKLMKISSKFITQYQGSFYALDSKGALESLIIVTAAGDCSIEQIINYRKKKGSLYKQEEAIHIIHELVKALKVLQKARIYHSDIKLANIVANTATNSYQVLDFGLSKLIPEGSETVPLEYYGNAGSRIYFSPEKRLHWEKKVTREKSDENKVFDPFRCDMWSLGMCFSLMIGGTSNASGKYLSILNMMLEGDWKKRPNAKELDLIMTQQFPLLCNKPGISDSERSLIKEIAHLAEEREDFRLLDMRLKGAKMNDERIVFLNNQLNKWNSKPLDLRTELDKENIAWCNHQLGVAFSEKADYKAALNCFEAALPGWLDISGGGYNRNSLKTMSLIGLTLDSMGDYQAALEILEETLNLQKVVFDSIVEDCKEIGVTISYIALIRMHMGEHRIAIAENLKAIEIFRKIGEKAEIEELATIRNNVAASWTALGNHQQALEEFDKVAQIYKTIHRCENHPSVTNALSNYASTLGLLGEHDKSLMEHNRVLELRKSFYGNKSHPDVALSLSQVAIENFFLGDYLNAINKYNNALEIYEKVLGHDHPRSVRTRNEISNMMKRFKAD